MKFIILKIYSYVVPKENTDINDFKFVHFANSYLNNKAYNKTKNKEKIFYKWIPSKFRPKIIIIHKTCSAASGRRSAKACCCKCLE